MASTTKNIGNNIYVNDNYTVEYRFCNDARGLDRANRVYSTYKGSKTVKKDHEKYDQLLQNTNIDIDGVKDYWNVEYCLTYHSNNENNKTARKASLQYTKRRANELTN